jgi:hypothetical protein
MGLRELMQIQAGLEVGEPESGPYYPRSIMARSGRQIVHPQILSVGVLRSGYTVAVHSPQPRPRLPLVVVG